MFRKTHPIIGTRDINRAIEFYVQRLGFQLAFQDNTDTPNYVGFRRDQVEFHMQFQYEHEMSTIRLRFLVDDPDALFTEYQQHGVECSASGIRDTPWGTREFALYDTDRNSLTFYRDLKSAENEHTTAMRSSERRRVVAVAIGAPRSRHCWVVRPREHTGVLSVQHTMNTNLRLVLIGGAGFCVGFTVCALLFVPTAKQQQASSIPSIQVVAAPLAGRSPPNAKPQLPEWQPHLMLPTLPPKFPGYQN